MKSKKLRFQLSLKKAKKGDKHPDISKIQQYLQKFGYLKDKCKPGELCHATSTAIRKYQRFHKLSATGTLNTSTILHMQKPRCDNSDPVGQSSRLIARGPADFTLSGCKYNKTSFTYRFLNSTPDIAGDAEQNAIRNALATWANTVNITFTEVPQNRSSDFEFGWFSGNHGDGNAFDGVSNTLAHAFYPPDCGGRHAGKCHFDEAETWANGGGGIDLETVALHEIGHLLGITHSRDANAVMAATYGGMRRNLTDGDIDAVRQLYPIFTRLNDSGNLAGTINGLSTVKHRTRQIITAVGTGRRSLRLIAWRVNNNGSFVRTGDSRNQAGTASYIEIVDAGNHHVTSCRTGSGNLMLISWSVNDQGNRITRVSDSGRLAGRASKIKIIPISTNLLVTACRAGNGNLLLITWRLNSDGTFRRIGDSGNLAGAVNDISLVGLARNGSTNRVLTSIRSGSGRLKLIVWNIANNGRISRAGDSGNLAGTASKIEAVVHPSGNVITSCRAGNGRLFLINWRISNRPGNRVSFTRVNDSHRLAGSIGLNSISTLQGGNTILSGVKTASGTLRLISFSLLPDGRINRIGDSANLAGDIGDISIPEPLDGSPTIVTTVKAGNGRLLLISWRP